MPYRVRVYVSSTRLDAASRRVSRVSCPVCIHLLVLDLNIHVYLTTTSMPHTGRTARNKNTQAKAMAKPKGCGRAPPSFRANRSEVALRSSLQLPLLREVGVRFWPSASHRTRSHAHALT